MSNIPRKSINPQSQTSIPRRSSSADVKWANANASVNNMIQMSSVSGGISNGRQSLIDGRQSITPSIGNQLGRASSVGGSNRQSMTGRPSVAGRQTNELRSNSEMASTISSVKIKTKINTQTIYLNFFLKNLGTPIA